MGVAVEVADDGDVVARDRRADAFEAMDLSVPDAVGGLARRVPEHVAVTVAVKVASERLVGSVHHDVRALRETRSSRVHELVGLVADSVEEQVGETVVVEVARQHGARRPRQARNSGEWRRACGEVARGIPVPDRAATRRAVVAGTDVRPCDVVAPIAVEVANDGLVHVGRGRRRRVEQLRVHEAVCRAEPHRGVPTRM